MQRERDIFFLSSSSIASAVSGHISSFKSINRNAFHISFQSSNRQLYFVNDILIGTSLPAHFYNTTFHYFINQPVQLQTVDVKTV